MALSLFRSCCYKLGAEIVNESQKFTFLTQLLLPVVKSVVCLTCMLDCTQIGFFIIYRFVVRVLRLRGRANRGRLAHRRRWGSRNLLSTLF